MIGWLRRLFRRSPDASERPLEVTVACDASQALAALGRATDLAQAIAAAPCEPTRAPDHVARAKANRDAHYRALGEDPDANWGPFVNPHDEDPEDAA